MVWKRRLRCAVRRIRLSFRLFNGHKLPFCGEMRRFDGAEMVVWIVDFGGW